MTVKPRPPWWLWTMYAATVALALAVSELANLGAVPL